MIGALAYSASARVSDRTDLELRVLLRDADKAAALPAAKRVAIVYQVGDRRCQARARPVLREGVCSLEVLAPARRKSDREFPRVTARIPVAAARATATRSVLIPIPEREPQRARVTLSTSGMSMDLPFQPAVGDRVDLILVLSPDTPPLPLQGEVVGLIDEARRTAALRFDHLHPEALARLAEFVQDLYLKALGTERG